MPSAADSFVIGSWRVHPQLNRLVGPGGLTVQVEPKMMDVLVCLARRPGEVVPREALIDAVWPEVFISESVLTRAIAGLRRALGDDARRPRFIETISKRGYRLIEAVSLEPAQALPEPVAAPAAPSYVIGQWVRADGFYGREFQLAEVMAGARNGFWVVGTRRRGKTSFLKQLEHLAVAAPARRLVPVFWDLQGVDTLDDLGFSFEEALADATPRLEELGASAGGDDVFRMLGAVRRRLHEKGRTLLLLCDEAEALIALAERSAAVVSRLRGAMLARDGVLTVLASGPRLWDLAVGSATSPFLDGFLPPLYLGALESASARALVRQLHMPTELRPRLSDDDVAAVCRWGGGHPFLLQLLSKRTTELGDVDHAAAAVAGDRSVTSLFEVDLELLDRGQQSTLDRLARGSATDRDVGSEPELAELERLGLVVCGAGVTPRVEPPLLASFLAARPEPGRSEESGTRHA